MKVLSNTYAWGVITITNSKSKRQLLLVIAILSLILQATSFCSPSPAQAETQTVTSETKESPRKLFRNEQHQLTIGEHAASFKSLAGRSIKGFLYALAALLVVLAVLKKIQANKLAVSPKTLIDIYAKRPLSSRCSLMLVKAEGHKFLVSCSNDQVSLISELTPDDSLYESSVAEMKLTTLERAENC